MTTMRTNHLMRRFICCLLALCCLTSMVYADDSGLPPEAQAVIAALRVAFETAAAEGDQAAMDAAHAAAEAVRSDFGYSGGKDGRGHEKTKTTQNYDYSSDIDFNKQMSGNSAAFFEASDRIAKSKLHVQNVILAALQDYYTGSTSTYADGNWTIEHKDGSVTKSKVTGNYGSNMRVVYETKDGKSNHPISETFTWTYETAANEALLKVIGDTPENRKAILKQYNDDAAKIAADNLYRYDDQILKDQVLQESGIYTLMTGKHISEEDKKAILAAKQSFSYLARIQDLFGIDPDSVAGKKMLEKLLEYNNEAEKIRAKYGFSCNSMSAKDGGAFHFLDDPDYDSTPYVVHYDPTITVSYNEGGKVSPGTQTCKYGSSQTFTITPTASSSDGYYYISSVYVDGKNVGAVSSYTFSNIVQDHTLVVTFAKPEATIVDARITSDNASKDGSIKAGYGIEANLNVGTTGSGNIYVTAVASYDFGNRNSGRVDLVAGSDGKFHFPVNQNSKTGAQKIYIPVTTKDGTYYVNFEVHVYVLTIFGWIEVYTLYDNAKVVVKGTMYEDDFTGDRS